MFWYLVCTALQALQNMRLNPERCIWRQRRLWFKMAAAHAEAAKKDETGRQQHDSQAQQSYRYNVRDYQDRRGQVVSRI